jgi:ABC-2 type transport system permease protein
VAVATAETGPTETAPGQEPPAGRPPSPRDFARLKLRVLRNGLRGQTWRIVAYTLSILIGLWIAVAVLIALAATAFTPRLTGFVVAVLAGAGIVLAWTLLPLLFFGVDESLDPARFALLPIPRMTLARGMLAAAFIGVPPLITLVATSGLVLAAALRFGGVAALAAAVGVLLGLCTGIIGSRAVTSAFATLLRSRRVRDLAAVVIALLASSIGPLQLLLSARVSGDSVAQVAPYARVVSWTPLGAPYALPFDVAGHAWLRLTAHLTISAATIGLLLWWWSHTIESAMLGTITGGAVRHRRAAAGSAVRGLIPAPLRRIARPTRFGAIVARESRFWWRDPRRRSSLVSILTASAVVPIALNVVSGPARAGAAVLPFSFAVSMCGTMGGMMLANQFAFDGNAYAAHVLTQVPGRVELRARALAVALVALPVQIMVVIAVSVLGGHTAQVPAGFGMLCAAFGAAVATASFVSVLAPYALPDNSNPFALNSATGSAKGMLALVAMIGTLVISSPIVVAAAVLGGTSVGLWVVFVLGVAYGPLVATFGTYAAGELLDRRGPEVLVAVTPRR